MGAGRAWTLPAVALGYSAVAVAGSPWTLYSAVFTAIPGLVLLGYALRRGWHRRRADRGEVEWCPLSAECPESWVELMHQGEARILLAILFSPFFIRTLISDLPWCRRCQNMRMIR